MRSHSAISGRAALILGCMACSGAFAGESAAPSANVWDLPKGRAELSSGFDMTASGWSSYGTAVIGLGGPLHNDGWRLRLTGSYALFSYQSRMTYCQLSAEEKKQRTGTNFGDLCNEIAGNPPAPEERQALADYLAPYGLTVEGDQLYATLTRQRTRYTAALAPGYQVTLGALILKAYLGAAYELHQTTPSDARASLDGDYWGAQGTVEAWWQMGNLMWISADGSYFTGSNSYGGSLKLGYQPTPWLALGPELAAFGEEGDSSARAGAFLRFDNNGMETTLAGGFSGTYQDDPSLYGTVSMYMKF